MLRVLLDIIKCAARTFRAPPPERPVVSDLLSFMVLRFMIGQI
jgi:hypothetical protein